MKPKTRQLMGYIFLIVIIFIGVWCVYNIEMEKRAPHTTDVLISTQKFNDTFNTSFVGIIVEDINEYHLYDIINKKYIMLYSADSRKGGVNEWYDEKSMVINESVVESAHRGYMWNLDYTDVYDDCNKIKIYYYSDTKNNVYYDNFGAVQQCRYFGSVVYGDGIPYIDGATRRIVNYTAVKESWGQKERDKWVYLNKTYNIYSIDSDYNPETKNVIYLINYIDNGTIKSIVIPIRKKPSPSKIDQHNIDEIVTGNKSTLTLKSIRYDNYPNTDGFNDFYWVLTLNDNSIELKG